jgi:hypothetical protein
MHAFLNGERSGVADRVAVSKTLGSYAGRCHRLMLGRQAPAGKKQVHASCWHKAAEWNFIVIIEQPVNNGLLSRV